MLLKKEIQFNEKTNKYEVSLLVEVPLFKIKNKLNFRIFKIKNEKDEIIRDPNILDSKYVFNLNSSSFGKKIYFVPSFNKEEFEKIKEIYFGFCDEGVSWIIKDLFVDNSRYYKNNDNQSMSDVVVFSHEKNLTLDKKEELYTTQLIEQTSAEEVKNTEVEEVSSGEKKEAENTPQQSDVEEVSISNDIKISEKIENMIKSDSTSFGKKNSQKTKSKLFKNKQK